MKISGSLRVLATVGTIQVLVIIINLVRSKFLAVMLGPAGLGVLSVIDQLVQLISYASAFSLPLATGKILSHAHSEGIDAFRLRYASLLRLLVTLTSGGTAVALGLILVRPQLLGSELSPYRLVVMAAVIRVPIISLHGYFTHVLAAARRWRASVLLLFFIAATLVVAAPIGIALGGLSGMYWSSLVAESAIVAGMLIYLRTELGLPLRERAVGVIRELRENRTLVTFATILQITSILHLGSYFAVRYLVLARYSEAAVGLLQAAIGLVAAIGLIVNNGTTLYLSPMLNRNMAKSEKLRMAVDYQRNLALVVGALAMPIVLFSPLLLHLLYSPAFAAVSPLVFLFAAAQCLTQLAAVCQALMVGLDDLKLYGLYLGAGHLSLVALAWILAPRYGLAGVAAAYVGSGGLLFVSMLGLLIVRHGLRLPWQLPLSVVYILASIFAVGMLPLHRSISEPLLIAGKLAYYGCFVLSLLLILGQDERRYLVGRATTIRGRILWLRRAYTPGTGWRPVQDAVGPSQGDIPATEGD